MANCLLQIVIATTGEPAKGCCVVTLPSLPGAYSSSMSLGTGGRGHEAACVRQSWEPGADMQCMQPHTAQLSVVWIPQAWLVLTTEGVAGSGEVGWLM